MDDENIAREEEKTALYILYVCVLAHIYNIIINYEFDRFHQLITPMIDHLTTKLD